MQRNCEGWLRSLKANASNAHTLAQPLQRKKVNSQLITHNSQLKTHGYTTSLYTVGSIGNVPVWNEPDELTDIANAYNAEDRLNSLRNNFRDAMIEDIENGNTNYQASVYYMDIINQYERMGDFMINISQDLERGFAKKRS